MAPRMEIIIIGGSCAGLMHAVVLKSLGHNVRVLEARSSEQIKARAAGLSLGPYAQRLFTTWIPDVDLNSFAIRNPGAQYLDADGNLLSEKPTNANVTTSTWGVVTSLLRQACERRIDGHGHCSYETEKRVCKIAEEQGQMVVMCKDNDGAEEIAIADIVIAADGARSFARSQVLPEIEPIYAGYFAWRGQLPASQTPPELSGALDGKLVHHMLKGSYILVYAAPSETGNTQRSDRVLEYCWYDPCDGLSDEFDDIMTDCTGWRHYQTVPQDLLRHEVWKAHLNRRKDVLPPLWTSLLSQASQPLVTAIQDFDNAKASFFGGKLLMVGEALRQIRPHLGASCDIAAMEALTLGEMIQGEMDIAKWEKDVVDYANGKAVMSKAVGTFGMTGKWPEGYVHTYLKQPSA
ncbi:FAD/NAD(P)-binding domain-containing protein [Dothidotthia symphoricarpi CBS 119687]|uniref:FAD/NAD(P)-binding domain-containing protein n=1 Tax=Dothidotthia symphoricarpi CBS 119687 TaxID=1392245 RepID=A0A6A6AMX9_9PLEO|nr:FAD/NAD(P)-binding domain-containing protein [Dothidotthia symphoricarpi CBS 119687]KAF2133289.1 FAD/NAD(P)-binding domain-containing protein [Dothidotthia symphoricarpi CBS 119687]